MLIFKKEKRVVKLCSSHIDKVLEASEAAAAAIRHYVKGEVAEAEGYKDQVGRLENEADSLRREIGDTLYDGAYLPQIRGDLFRLIQGVDAIANKCEDAWEFFATQNPEIPSQYAAAFVEVIDAMMLTVTALHRALSIYFKPKGKIKSVREEAQEVAKGESRVDEMEWNLTQRLFNSDMDLANKMHLKRGLTMICDISDCAEDAADEVDVVSMKSVV